MSWPVPPSTATRTPANTSFASAAAQAILARELKLDRTFVELLEQAAILHDVGKIGIPDSILLKPGKLDPAEMECMKLHCDIGVNILSGISHRRQARRVCRARCTRRPALRSCKMASTIAGSHHERWDGTGYPQGLAGEDIPLEGRIVAVADVLDALGTWRPYKAPLPFDQCVKILEEGRGRHFDPQVLDAFLRKKDYIAGELQQLRDWFRPGA